MININNNNNNNSSNNSSNYCNIFKSISNTLSLEMSSIESSMITHPKHLCIRLATGPQYYS